MSLLEHYHQQCAQGLITKDPLQLHAIEQLQGIYQELIREQRARKKLLARFRKPISVKGLYLWGGVGIGKTFMMDCFFQYIPFAEKKRFHFHQFMRWVHEELRVYQGKQDPLVAIAKTLAKNTLLLCFDEFVVNDIADAMILGRLFAALFAEGICLVATSNISPDDLYKNGLQRKLFLPTIALIKSHATIFNLSIEVDYRLRHLKTAGVFFTPNDEAAQENMEKCFELLTVGEEVKNDALEICDRKIQVKKVAGKVVWFDFATICGVPRSQYDYLELAKQFKTILISDIPVMTQHQTNTISLFIRLIDVLYDEKIRLVCSAAAPVQALYPEGRLHFEYARTCSRLIEMQSEGYF